MSNGGDDLLIEKKLINDSLICLILSFFAPIYALFRLLSKRERNIAYLRRMETLLHRFERGEMNDRGRASARESNADFVALQHRRKLNMYLRAVWELGK